MNYQDYEVTIKAIRNSLARWEIITKNRHHDKVGLAIDTDDRFRVFQITFALDAWDGVYGSSSCSTALSVGKKEVFEPAFKAVLKKEILDLLAKTATHIEQQAAKSKADEVARLKLRLAELENTNGA